MKRWLFKITSLFTSLVLILILCGCKKSDSDTIKDMMARTGTIQERPPVEVIDIVGEAFIRSSGEEIDNRTRVAALLDAMRKLARKKSEQEGSIFSMQETTVTLDEEWDGLKLHAVTTYRMGVVISDLVEVTLSGKNGKSTYAWRLENMELVKPEKGKKENLKKLQQAMRERNFELESNHRLGNDTWCEVVTYRDWGKVE